MKNVDEAGQHEAGVQLALSFDAYDSKDQSHLPLPAFIESARAFPLTERKVLAFPKQRVSPAEAGLIARILQRTRHFV
ncbi:hypothetical protein [Pseudomonas lactis]|uniref:Uncharacterized protein n=1 Tax=Pseudomonas lactis TaxID=1615674 RepID=A0A7Y1MJV0_9PSED|nr:hypothetical protein [Pseudomonas lactis]KRP69589.1 hypothetical protein TX24_29895 [Pseudomonas lactis]NNA76908.1 hypothetical protein [Pseudomonas lactis]NNA83093.1 hypothetical protein [Pseudomonas lactis]